jgi:hypothetical protein
LAQLPKLSRELRSIHVLIRLFLRMSILVIFAAFASIGFGRSLAALLCMSVIFSVVIATIRRELPFDVVLNHWDETLVYVALFALVSSFNHSVPA